MVNTIINNAERCIENDTVEYIVKIIYFLSLQEKNIDALKPSISKILLPAIVSPLNQEIEFQVVDTLYSLITHRTRKCL